MSNTRLFTGAPMPTVEEFAPVCAAALFILPPSIAEVIPLVLHGLSKRVATALCVMVTGLCLFDRHPTATRIARQLGVVGHNGLARLLAHPNWSAVPVMLALFESAMCVAAGTPVRGWLILDDMLLPKRFARHIAGAHWDHDHTEDRTIYGIRLVVLVWTEGLLTIPVAFLIWHKKGCTCPRHYRRYRTKNDLARILVWKIVRRGLPFAYLTFDSWYASEENLNFFDRLRLRFYTTVRPNRRFKRPLSSDQRQRSGRGPKPQWEPFRQCSRLATDYPRKQDYHYYPALELHARSFVGKLVGVRPQVKLVIVKDYARSPYLAVMVPTGKRRKKERDPNKYLITNSLATTTRQVIERTRSRWAVEVFFRDAKQLVGLAAGQMRTQEQVHRHIALSFLAYVCLERYRQQLVGVVPPAEGNDHLTLGDVKRHLQRQVLVRLMGPDGHVHWLRAQLDGLSWDDFQALRELQQPFCEEHLTPLTFVEHHTDTRSGTVNHDPFQTSFLAA